MAKFAYNNTKNTNTDHMLFELNYGYHPYVLFKEDINSLFRLKIANKLLAELQELMTVY